MRSEHPTPRRMTGVANALSVAANLRGEDGEVGAPLSPAYEALRCSAAAGAQRGELSVDLAARSALRRPDRAAFSAATTLR